MCRGIYKLFGLKSIVYALYATYVYVSQNMLFFIKYKNRMKVNVTNISEVYYLISMQWFLSFLLWTLNKVNQLINVYVQYWFSPMLFIATLDPDFN